MSAKKKLIIFLISFFAVLAHGFFRVKYYTHPDLTLITGSDGPNRALVAWDSGAGYNPVERALVDFRPVATREVVITRNAEGQKSGDVWIEEIRPEPQGPLDLKSLSIEQNLPYEAIGSRHIIRLTEGASRLFFKAQAASAQITFRADVASGRAVVTLDGAVAAERSLFSETTGTQVEFVTFRADFTECKWEGCAGGLRLPLSPLPIRQITMRLDYKGDISKAFLRSSSKTLEIPLSREPNGAYVFNVHDLGNQAFNPFYFGTQVLCALLIACSLIVILKHAPLNHTLFQGTRVYFWLFFLIFLIPSLVVWMYNWPITMYPDSSYMWHTAHRFDFTEDTHPFLNAFWVLLLLQIWDHPGVIALSQIIATSALTAFIFYYMIEQGVGRLVVILCATMLSISIPVALINSSHWRDAPYTLIILFWAFFLVALANNRAIGRKVQAPEMFLLVTSLAFLMMRHNGKVPLILIPATALFLHLLPFRKAVLLVACTAATFYFTQVTLRRDIFKIQKFYPQHELPGFSKNFLEYRAKKDARNTVLKYFTIFDLRDPLQYFPPWRDSHGASGGFGEVVPGQGYKFQMDRDVRFFKLQPLIPELGPWITKVINSSYEKPFLYLQWEPFYMLYLFIPPLLCFWWFPRSAIFSFLIISQTLILFFLAYTTIWRYYYSQYLACFFILPVILLDLVRAPKDRIRYLREVTFLLLLVATVCVPYALPVIWK